VLTLLGGALGVLSADWASSLLAGLQPPVPVPVALDFGLDARVLLFAFGVTGIVTLGSALAPAVRATRIDEGEGLRSDSATSQTGGRRIGLRDALVVAQVAVSLVVLAAAGLFLGSLREATRIDPGFATTRPRSWRSSSKPRVTRRRGKAFYDELVRRARALLAPRRRAWRRSSHWE
jgi:hypothetical protein